jgi:hypothetical protein
MFGCRRDSKVYRVDRAPAGTVGHTRELGNPRGPLRRDDIGDVGFVRGEIGYEGAGLGIDRI